MNEKTENIICVDSRRESDGITKIRIYIQNTEERTKANFVFYIPLGGFQKVTTVAIITAKLPRCGFLQNRGSLCRTCKRSAGISYWLLQNKKEGNKNYGYTYF